MDTQKRREIDHMYKTFAKVKDKSDKLLEHRYFPEDPLEERFRLLLKEKRDTIGKLLFYWDKEELPEDTALIEWLKIIYRADETEKIHFQSWKRVCSQNQFLDEQTLQEMEESFNGMKKNLEEALPHEESIVEEAHIPYIVPSLYR